MSTGYVFCFLFFCLFILFFFSYRLIIKIYKAFYWNKAWENTINLETIVNEIITKALIISIQKFKDSKSENTEKTKLIVENACAISADVLLQHSIDPRDYNLPALVEIAIFRINTT